MTRRDRSGGDPGGDSGGGSGRVPGDDSGDVPGAATLDDSDAVLDALLRRCRFPPPDEGPVVLAVSGGADSLALLVLAARAGLSARVVHIDHGLRGADTARGEWALVEQAARRFAVASELVRIDLDDGPNLEARARAARYAALPPDVLTGHTADDQAETILLALLRGSGLSGLSGMDPDGRPRRPLLALRRSETELVCRLAGLAWADDASNDDPRHRRNRVRRELVPLLDELADRDVTALLVRQAGLLREEDRFLDELAATIDPTDVRSLAGAPKVLARRALRRWLAPALGGYPPDQASVERVLQVVEGHAVACELPGGVRVSRSAMRLSVAASAGGDSVR